MKPYDKTWNPVRIMTAKTLIAPLRWRKPRRARIIIDLFHASVPDEFIDKVFAVMAMASQHTFQVLTKRPERMQRYLSTLDRHNTLELAADAMFPDKGRPEFGGKHKLPRLPLRNVWLGVSVEDQQEATERITHLLQTPAAVRWLACDPQEPIHIWDAMYPGHTTGAGGTIQLRISHCIGWVVVAKPARWRQDYLVRFLRDQCEGDRVPFFFEGRRGRYGRLLDGRTHEEMPA